MFAYLFGNLSGLVITLSVVLILYYKWTFQYWKRRNVPYLQPKIPFGNVGSIIKGKENVGVAIKRVYDEMKRSGWKHGGIYSFLSPTFIALDLDHVKNVMTKDFQYFTHRNTYCNEKDDPLSAHLVNLNGTKWRNLRTKVTPTFTSGKMKMMFPSMAECLGGLLKRMDAECDRNRSTDVKEVLACFTTDVIGSCAFGLQCNSFEQENSPFRTYGRKAFNRSRYRELKRVFCTQCPNLARHLGVTLTPKDVGAFYMKVVKDTVTYRETNNKTRNDFLQLLLDLKNNRVAEEEAYKHDGKSLTIEEVAAQSFVFFLAGFETSSTLMTFALYELARNQEVQQKLREEIEEVLAKHDGQITYDSLQDMKYMNQVIDESFRMHPPVPLVNRKCVKDYKLPDEDVVIEKGTTVIIPILGIHYDPDHYPEPEKFDPERFTEENKNSRHSYAHLPFGEGPRICIGMRFGLLQSKLGLAALLKNYKFTVDKKTKEPLEMASTHFIMSARGDIWLSAEKL